MATEFFISKTCHNLKDDKGDLVLVQEELQKEMDSTQLNNLMITILKTGSIFQKKAFT